jgi:hypothetical protein
LGEPTVLIFAADCEGKKLIKQKFINGITMPGTYLTFVKEHLPVMGSDVGENLRRRLGMTIHTTNCAHII